MVNNNEENVPPVVDLSTNIQPFQPNPLTVDNIRLEDIFDKETIKRGAESFIALINQIPETEKARLEIRKKELDNELALKQLETEDLKYEIESTQIEYTHLNNLDKRNKWYTLLILITVIIACITLKYFDILDKSEARTIIIIAIATGLKSNSELLKNMFSKRDD